MRAVRLYQLLVPHESLSAKLRSAALAQKYVIGGVGLAVELARLLASAFGITALGIDPLDGGYIL
jgi:hypothetical protein